MRALLLTPLWPRVKWKKKCNTRFAVKRVFTSFFLLNSEKLHRVCYWKNFFTTRNNSVCEKLRMEGVALDRGEFGYVNCLYSCLFAREKISDYYREKPIFFLPFIRRVTSAENVFYVCSVITLCHPRAFVKIESVRRTTEYIITGTAWALFEI